MTFDLKNIKGFFFSRNGHITVASTVIILALAVSLIVYFYSKKTKEVVNSPTEVATKMQSSVSSSTSDIPAPPKGTDFYSTGPGVYIPFTATFPMQIPNGVGYIHLEPRPVTVDIVGSINGTVPRSTLNYNLSNGFSWVVPYPNTITGTITLSK